MMTISGKRLNAAARYCFGPSGPAGRPGGTSALARDRPFGTALRRWLFQLQQQPLAPQPAAVAAQFAVLVDHAMTRNQNRDPVAPVGSAHGARCSGTPNRPRQFLIGARLAIGDPQQARPY